MSQTASLSAPTAMPNGRVTWQNAGGVALVTLTNPPANGYSHEMMLDLDAAILRARFDTEICVIVIAGEGEKFFCAGADISMLDAVTPEFKYSFCLHANETMLRLEHTPKLTIAALGGHCVGGGLEIALSCDLRIARRNSGRCGLPEVKLGVLPGTGGTQRLCRVLGKSKAIELMITGELLDYETAASLGLINRLYDADGEDAFLEQVLSFAAELCPPGHASLAVGSIKRAVQTGAEIPLEAGLALERELQAKLFASADAAEGISAFMERREPVFTGR
jgi:enoyl-CoA hydratase/carnithine racemase